MFKHILWLFLVLLPHAAQAQTDVQLQVRLRYSDGTPVVGETVVLEGLPEAEPVLSQANHFACTTNNSGQCTWSVPPGLYQLFFSRPLDDLSALALAEGGLSGFGLTVGEEDIAYHFTFHSDGRVYFDDAPESAVPAPIIPEPDDLHPPVFPTKPSPAATATPPPSSVFVTNTQAAAPESGRRLVLFIVRGLALGITLHFFRPFIGRGWTRIRTNLAQKRPNTSEEEQEA